MMVLKRKLTRFMKGYAFGISGALVLFAYLLWSFYPSAASTQSALAGGMLVAVRDLELGAYPRFSDFRIKQTDRVPDGVVTDQELEFLSRAVLEKPIAEGESLTYRHLRRLLPVALRVERGHRAYPVRVEASHPARTGDTVDLLGVPRDTGQFPSTLLESVIVLERREKGSGAVLVLSVHKSALSKLGRATQVGVLSVILASRYDMNNRKIIKSRPKRRIPVKKIEIING